MKYIAFLRAINVTGRYAKMVNLKSIFEKVGCGNVQTIATSGNIYFTYGSSRGEVVERKLEAALGTGLGFEIKVFLRTTDELSRLCKELVVHQHEIPEGGALHVLLLKNAPSAAQAEAIRKLGSDINRFVIHGKDLCWISAIKADQAKFSAALLERKINDWTTLRRATMMLQVLSTIG